MADDRLKDLVKLHWESEPCGTRYADPEDEDGYFDAITAARDRLEPYIPQFADFASGRGRRVLEVGVGAGSDFERWCLHAYHVAGVDLTESAIALTQRRLEQRGTSCERYELQVADVEDLPFPDGRFDLVWSWGVLHHTPDTPAAFREVWRVLRPGGELRCMVYHLRSWTAWMLAAQRAWTAGSFLAYSPRRAVYELLESPGTKAYTIPEARALVTDAGFVDLRIRTVLAPGDLLTIVPSDRYRTRWARLLWKVYPRPIVRALGNRFGLAMLIRATKPDLAPSDP